MKNFLLYFFFCTSIFQLQAENVDRTINWTVPRNIVYATEHFVWPDFTGSVKSDRSSIPCYFETIKVEQLVSSAQFVNPKLSALDGVPIELAGSFSEEIKFSYHFFNSGKEKYLQIELVPFVKKDGQLFRVDSFQLEITETESQLKSAKAQVVWSQSSVLSSGKWLKIATSQSGIHKIKYSDLQSWGFANPAQVNVFGNGGYMLPVMNNEPFSDDLQQIAVWHSKDGSNTDCLFFYSTGTIKWAYDTSTKMFVHQQNSFSDKAFYFLTDTGNNLLIQNEARPSATPEKQVAEYDCYLVHESEESNLINSGASWYSNKHTKGQERMFSFNFANRIETDTLKLFIQTIGRSSSSSKMNVFVNSLLVGEINYYGLSLEDPESMYGRPGNLRKDKVLSGATISVKTNYVATPDNSEAWIDFIDVNSRCTLALSGAQLLFRDVRTVKNGSVTEYKIAQAASGTKVWDVSNYLQPKSVSVELSGTDLKFVVGTSQLREFVAFNPSGDIPVPEKVGNIENQNLHAAAIAEFVIVTHPRFLEQANELADFHRGYDQMSVAVYTTDQVYNEFSSGLPDVAGIRNFIRMCYEKSSGGNGLKYVLLFGDGSFDNKDIRKKGYNLVPTYQSSESLSPIGSFVSDDFFVLLDPDEGGYTGLEDLGIGRIPARTVSEASAVVAKIKSYVNADALGKWRNVVCFIGDDGNNADGFTNLHMEQTEEIADLVDQNYPAFYADKIYFDAYRRESSSGMATYPEVNDAINERVKEGVLVLNYIGHANEEFLADEQVLDISMIDSWSNYKNLPIFVTATCEFSRFDEDELSAGEHILFNPNGGGIGLFSTTRLVFSDANFNLTKSFYNHVFEKDGNGENLRMGDIMRLAKVGSNTGINKRNFTLLADPALRLAYPKLSVKTETINEQSTENFTKTVSALEKITITGSVTNYQGNVKSDFNGTVIPIVYDKAIELETLGNAGQNPMTFTMQDNVIYKGNVSVTNGKFSFSFIVPKDISYSIDKGKIIYYADNGETDAHGAFDDFLIGGSSGTTIPDNEGPVIKMYMNDASFQSGDKVGASPLLIAEVSDENGINTVGTGIGHDITAFLDDDYSNIFVLNDYYESDIDSYKSGKIVFPVNDLEPGKHSLTLKVWDVVNNSSEATIEFVVTSDFRISEVFCYPNPVTDYVWFSFIHNLPDGLFSATIELFDRSGKCVDLIEKQIPSDGMESIPFKWLPSESNVALSSGMYLVRFTITSAQGYTTAKIGRFIFLKK
ncbi:MAG: hypothetical protein A2W90_12405 [Bacteroidetes bacterium GWF2_42_66]|nr:MAG: hypothetical protein A2W92_23020 [Bacteroidetes bacterium GWA2_42_15]OFX99987.1 MAG: hypothetical protein A2W89_17390 [Bacteroidetes bacterium GWE2_42_39]OFY40173.1 MAG: hypothetical protein A2W90_12405 [Bacteroidetes bacterium GWF2_42_66]HBL74002.1 hypothetical protein [Prolixibacteraceae bacterium]HCR91906.1 hypothetical protein [Prolixibacteraceae bacterium]